jgi:thiamine-phosphate pyrophosphorylase
LLLYYITDRHQFPGSEPEKRQKLLARIAEAARCGVDFIQLRERDLSARELESLAEKALAAIRSALPPAATAAKSGPRPPPTASSKLLINSRLDIALAVGADGVHLRSTDMAASEARTVVAKAFHENEAAAAPGFTISVSCHTRAEVRLAEAHGADLALFAPVFEKADEPFPQHGIAGLRAVCRDKRTAQPPVPILALGGVTITNAAACLRAGAAGVAGMRLFQEGDLDETVSNLRKLKASS